RKIRYLKNDKRRVRCDCEFGVPRIRSQKKAKRKRDVSNVDQGIVAGQTSAQATNENNEDEANNDVYKEEAAIGVILMKLLELEIG
ncbi:hypothetical protein PIB30_094628, partial [Stylosanthes scabra]|nr:hypothetical protein [Stylosanthes scabra]